MTRSVLKLYVPASPPATGARDAAIVAMPSGDMSIRGEKMTASDTGLPVGLWTRRTVTTTPLQALTLMNNSFVQRQSRVFAERMANEAGADMEAQIALAYRYAFGRSPDRRETERALEVAKQHGLKPVCWALLNASEFVNVR